MALQVDIGVTERLFLDPEGQTVVTLGPGPRQLRDTQRHRQSVQGRVQRRKALCEKAFGPGSLPQGRHYLVAHSEAARCRHTGERPPIAAEVITAEKDVARRHFRMIDGAPVEFESYQAAFGKMLSEPDPEKVVMWGGKEVCLEQCELYWASFKPGMNLVLPSSSRQPGSRFRTSPAQTPMPC